MKITAKLLVFALAVVTAFSVAGCKGRTDKAPVKDVTLVDFETWAPDFQLCRMSPSFGKVSPNVDPKYVKNGLKSARIDPVGNGWVYFPTYSEQFEFDYTDFTLVESVRAELYNPQEKKATVRLGLVTEVAGLEDFLPTAVEAFELEPGWNVIELPIDPSVVCLIADIKEVQGVYFKFDSDGGGTITQTSPRYYLDTIKLIGTDTAHSTQSDLQFGPNEIIDFERFYHKYFLLNDFGVTMEIVGASEYDMGAPSGTKILRLVVPGTGTGSWRYYFKLMAPFLKAGALGKLTEEQFQNAYFCWDSYNAGPASFNVVAIFHLGAGTKDFRAASYPEPGKWTTHRVKLTDIEEALPGWRTNPGMFAFSVHDNTDTEREVFFDNFRVEIE